MICEYRCHGCLTEFHAKYPGPVKCPSCSDDYAEWLNYAVVRAELDALAQSVPTRARIATERTGTAVS